MIAHEFSTRLLAKVRVYTSHFTNLWYGPWDIPPEEKPKTYVKVVCAGPEERVVGVHMYILVNARVPRARQKRAPPELLPSSSPAPP